MIPKTNRQPRRSAKSARSATPESPIEPLRRLNRALRVISAVNQTLIRASQESDLLQQICRLIVLEGGYRLAWVGYAEQDENKTVRPVAQAGFEEGYLETLRLTWADAEREGIPIGAAIRTGEPALARNIPTDSRFAPWRAEATRRGYCSAIALPLISAGQTFGALNIYAAEPDAFDAAEMKLLTELVNDLAYGIVTLRARQALHEHQARLQSIFRAAPTGIGVVRDRVFVEVNERLCEMVGYTRAELLGQNARLIYPTDAEYEYVGRVKYAQIRERGTGAVETRFQRKDGTIIDVLLSSTPLALDDLSKGVTFTALDITARKRAEEALRHERDLLARIAETSPAGITLVNRAGQITFANARAEQVLGLTRDEITQRVYNAPGWRITDYDGNPFPDEQLPFRRVMSTGKPVFDVRHAIEWQDGRRVLLSVSAAPLFDASGQVDSVVATVEDATEQVLAHEALARALRDWEQIFQAIGHATLILDAEHNIVAANRAAIRAVGQSTAELTYKKCYTVFHGTDHPPKDCPLARLRTSGRMETEEMEVAALGGIYLVSCTPVFDAKGQLQKVIHIATDVTERKRAEEALRESEAKYRTLFEASTDAIFVETLEGKVLDCNDAAAKLLGYSKAELTALTVADLVPEQVAQTLPAVIAAELTTGGVFIEAFNRRKNGQVFPCEVSTRLVTLGGEPRVIAYVRDITARKRAEEELRRRAAEFSALYDTARDLAAEPDLSTLLNTIAERARQLFAVSISEVCLYDPARGDLELVVAQGYTPPQDRRLQMGEGMAGQVAQTRQPLIVDDYHAWAGRSAKYAGTPISSSMQVPMLHHGELIGVIGIGEIAPRTHPFSESDARLLTLFAAQAASAVHNARLLAETRTRAARLAALNATITSANQAGTDLKALLEVALDHTLQALGMAQGGIWLAPAAGEELVFTVRGLPEEIGAAARQIIEAQQIDLSGTIARDDLQSLESPIAQLALGYGIRTLIATPLVAAGKRVGSLSLVGAQPHHWSDEEIALLEAIGRELGAAAERARLFAETRRRLAELEAVNRLSTALRAAQTLDEMLPRLLDETLAVLHTDAGSIWLYDPASNALRKRMERGWRAPIGEPAIRPGEGISGNVFATGAAHLSREYAADPLTHPQVRQGTPAGWGGACVPLRTAQEIIGVFFVSVQLPRELTPDEVHLLTTLAEIAGNAIHRASLHEQTQRQLQHVQTLRTIDRAITASLDVRVTLDILLGQTTAELRVDAAAVLLLNPHTQMLEYAAGHGFHSTLIQSARVRLGEGLAGRAALERRIVAGGAWRTPRDAPPDARYASLAASEGFVMYFGVPLIAKGEVKGVLEIFHRAAIRADRDWLDTLEGLGAQAAIAIDNAALFDDLQRRNTDLALAYDTTLEGWSRALDLRDEETEGHTQRIVEMTLRLARAMRLSEDALVHIRRGVLLHDIGKMGIPDRILLKPGPLDEMEWQLMRRHPVYAYEFLSPITYLRPAIDIPYCHHERWDGAGYPRGLQGERIPLAARIFAVVDVWDAMRAQRPYRAGLPDAEVRSYIQSQAGKHFDPQVVEAFLRLLNGA